MSLLVDRVGCLVTWEPEIPVRHDAALVISDGRVAWVGASADAPAADTRLDAAGGTVLPGFVDAHTHLVFGGDRAEEFEARLTGRPYTAGGIRTTVASTRATSTAELLARTQRLPAEALRSGTTTLEIKSGYGLPAVDERRCLDVARQVTPHCTFLGAHVVPEGISAANYVQEVCSPMLNGVADIATGIDAFCEDGAFDADQCRAVLSAGAARGMCLHIHANQLRPGPGVALAAELGAASADHCTHVSDRDITDLRDADVVAVLVPAAEFSTRSPYAPARRLLDAAVTVALASDCNPGTSYTTSMPFVIALACREMAMSPLEAVRAATLGGARALRSAEVGQLAVGARGDLVVLDAPTYVHLAYRPGVNLVRAVVRNGVVVSGG